MIGLETATDLFLIITYYFYLENKNKMRSLWAGKCCSESENCVWQKRLVQINRNKNNRQRTHSQADTRTNTWKSKQKLDGFSFIKVATRRERDRQQECGREREGRKPLGHVNAQTLQGRYNCICMSGVRVCMCVCVRVYSPYMCMCVGVCLSVFVPEPQRQAKIVNAQVQKVKRG